MKPPTIEVWIDQYTSYGEVGYDVVVLRHDHYVSVQFTRPPLAQGDG